MNFLQAQLAPINRRFAKLAFGNSARLDFYRGLLLLLNNQVRLNESLSELYKVYSDDGKKPDVPVAIIIDDCLSGMNEGESFSVVLSKWVPNDEGMLLQAGELAGKLNLAFSEAEQIMQAKRRIIGAIVGAITYPIVLFAMMGFLLRMIATDLVPKLAKVVDPVQWQGAAGMLRDISYFVTDYGLTSVVCIVTISLCIILSLSKLKGSLRVALDSIPPWSIYRLIQGSTFLLTVSALIKSGMQLNTALDKVNQHANPWLKERINATQYELTEGKNFGEALTAAGHNFPDKKANRFLTVISNYGGADDAIANFANQWLEETVIKIQSIAKLMLALGVMCIGITMLIVIAGAGGLQEAIQTSVGA